jgi:hypothetical protein
MSAPDSTALRRIAGVAGLVYLILYFVGNFPTGIGYEFHSGRPPAEVVSWATAHASIVHFGVFVDLVADLLFAGFIFLLVALCGTRSLAAPIAYVGTGISNAVFTVVLGLQLSVPELARLPGGDPLAQAAVVTEWTIESSLRPAALTIALAAVGYILVKSRVLPRVFGIALVVLAAAVAIGLPGTGTSIAFLAPLAGVLGLKIWVLLSSVVLLARPGPSEAAARPDRQSQVQGRRPA